MATVVSFINFKGGVGKTTLSVEIELAPSWWTPGLGSQ
jgi:MinD-like ATPase involved in chromosome partitioning or flagellar assembly